MLVLFGVVIGAVLSYFVARVERVSLERHRQMSAMKAIFAEIREVQKIVQDPRTMTTNTLMRFPSESWHLYKQHIEVLSQPVQQDLLSGYSKLIQANNIADWALYNLPYGSGSLNDRYHEEVKRMCEALKVAEEHLQDWINEDNKVGNSLRKWLES